MIQTVNNYSQTVKQLVDDIKAICAHNGLGGEASEYKIVTQMFLYKFLNDKFLFVTQKNYAHLKALPEAEYNLLLRLVGTKAAKMKPQHLLEHLHSLQDKSDFAETFDDVLNDIAVFNSGIYSVHTDVNTEIRLFDEKLIQSSVADQSKRNDFSKSILGKLLLVKFDDEIFAQSFDFFSTLFEYMIKDYNKDGGGKYAEYYTPHTVAKIMAEILVGDDKSGNKTVYDPSAGSGTLLMNIASKIGTDRCTIYSQDISQKSSNLLRLNLILNNLSHSINNIVQGNTILHSRHTKKMDYIVSNPPFKLDFSEWRNEVETLPNSQTRFFAGVPNIPNKDTDKMAIYLLFLQHIIYSLNENGKAAVVVPTGFVTGGVPKVNKKGKGGKGGIDYNIRKLLVDNKWLKGVVSMPSNIFATTGTNVSVLLIDKANIGKVVLVDASKLGEKRNDDGTQKTYLSSNDEQQIIDAFTTREPKDDFSVVLDYDQIKTKNYSLAAGQYFEIKIAYSEMTEDEFQAKMEKSKKTLTDYFAKSKTLETEILASLNNLHFNGGNNE
ncbi:MAG: type I restriction-modification system subunit M [Ignavibacteria bacterium]|jgi:type I restriction enzyme M protein|nr:type I restriction-modification system subunit M [Ignavibacteria bacterium]